MTPLKSLLLAMLSIPIALATAAYAEENHRADTLAADLAFNVECLENAGPPSPMMIERFLEGRGFRVLDIVRTAQEQHVTYPYYTANIFALDANHRMIKFTGFPINPQLYFVVLNSPPPTRHDTDLEDGLIAFVADQLQCAVSLVSRNENSEAAGPLHDDIFKRVEGLFKKAEEMRLHKS